MNHPSSPGRVVGLPKIFLVLFVSIFALSSGPLHVAAASAHTAGTPPPINPGAVHPPDAPGWVPGFEHDESGNATKNANVSASLGAFTYQIPIVVPSGRNGETPNLSLDYSSQSGDNNDIFGYGWNISIPSVERFNYLGLDNLFSSTTAKFSSSLSGELASTTSTGAYVARVDGGDDLQYIFSNNAWSVADKKGNTYFFGTDAAARQDNPSDSSQVFKWMLEKQTDANGNSISYTYTKDSGQIYPSGITYTNTALSTGPFSVAFTLGLRATSTATSSETGFPVFNRYQVNQISAAINASTTRSYALSYGAGDNGSRLVLSSVTESGTSDSGVTTNLVPTSFSYATSSLSMSSGWQDEGAIVPVAFSAFGDTSQSILADVNGDGLSDVIEAEQSASGSIIGLIALNTGTGWADGSSWFASIPCVLTSYSASGYPRDIGTRIVDVNGDGLADFICGYNVYLNTGSGWSLSDWVEPVPEQFSWKDAGVRFMDINHDGLPDIVQSYVNDDGGYQLTKSVWLNNGHGWTQQVNWQVPVIFGVSGDGGDIGVQIEDVNDDGIPDFITGGNPNNYTNTIYLGTGTGWATSTSWQVPSAISPSDRSVRFADLNGDGLVDIAHASYYDGVAPGSWDVNEVYFNTGTGWILSSSTIPFPIESDGIDSGTRIGDFNGDGAIDFLQSGVSNNPAWSVNDLLLGQHVGVDLPHAIKESTGSSVAVTYKGSASYVDGSGNPLNPQLPESLITVSRLDHYDGLEATTTTSYTYKNGSQYYGGPFDRQLAGFGEISQADTAGNLTNTFYHQGNGTASTTGEYNDDEAKIGKPYRIETTDVSGNPFTTQINKWDDASSGGLSSFVKLIQSTLLTYGPSGDHDDKSETYTYNDANGDLTERTEWGQVNAANDGSFTDTGTDKFVNDASYAASSTSPLSLPDQTTTVDQSGNTVRQTTDYYDNLPFGSVSLGNRTKELKWITGTTTAETDTTYNSYGLPTQTKDADSNATNYNYDTYNLYPATTTDALGYTSTALYDYSAGKPMQTTNENGITFKTIFDGLDRVLEQDEPDPLNPSSLVPKTKYAYTDAGTPRSVQETDYLNSSSTTVSYAYFDGFDRPVQKLSEAEGANTYTSTVDTYDTRGLLQSESLPYFVNTNAFTALSNPPANSLLTAYTYDPLKRVVKTTTNIGSSTSAYDGWETTATDPDGHAKDYLNDPYGNLLQVIEHNNDGNYTTNYVYDGNNNVTRITDANGNVRNFSYDGLSRRTSAEDLHTATSSTFGTWTYTYDSAGNLTKQKDPKNQTTNFTYDALNRVLTENSMRGISQVSGTSSGVDISYNYDSCAYGKMRLCTATTSAAVTSYTHTPLGATASEKQVISGQAFTTSYAYDRLGNKTGITYPDGSLVSYIYNAAGLLESISETPSGTTTPTTIVSDFDYAPSGRVSYELFGNGDATTNTYDPNQLYRLTQILTVASTTPQQAPAAPAAVPKMESASSTSSLPTTSTGSATSTPPATTTPTVSLAPTYALSDDPVQDADLGTDTTTPTVDVPPVDTSEASTSEESVDSGDSASSTPVVSTAPEATSTPDDAGSSTHPVSITGPRTSTTTASTTISAVDPLALTPDVPPPPTSTTIQDISYVYDPAGNITNVYDYSSTQASHVSTFTYDYLNRLKSASTTAASTTPYSQTYKYDKVGNITSGPLGTYAYTGANNANPDAVNTIGSAILKYDKDGNLTKYDSTSYAWDYRNRLSSIMGNGATSTYAYDFQNNRVIKTTATSTSYYPNDLYSLNGTTPRRNIFTTDGTLVAVVRGSASSTKTFTIHPDNLGSTNVITDSTGSSTGVTDYYPYGSERVDTGTSVARKFIGEEYDADSQLSYLNARYYEGARGQFLSQDPQFWSTKQNLQDPQSLNAYSYSDDNPINEKDPSGEIGEKSAKPYVANLINSLFDLAVNLTVFTLESSVHEQATANAVAAQGQQLGQAIRSGAAYNSAANSIQNFLNSSDEEQGAMLGKGSAFVASMLISPEFEEAEGAAGAASNIPKVTGDNAPSFWHQSTFGSPEDSLQYHVGQHGKGDSPELYTLKGLQTFADYKNLAVPTTLKDGSSGLRIFTQPDGRGGYFTPNGLLVTHWY